MINNDFWERPASSKAGPRGMANSIISTILCFTLCMASFHANSQIKKLDSLKNLLRSEVPADSNKVKIYTEIAIGFMHGDYSGFWQDSAKQYLDKALQISREINYKKGLIISLNYLGRVHHNKGLHYQSLEFFNKAILELGNLSWTQMEADINLEIGHIYGAMLSQNKSPLMYARAMSHYRMVIAICDNSRNFI